MHCIVWLFQHHGQLYTFIRVTHLSTLEISEYLCSSNDILYIYLVSEWTRKHRFISLIYLSVWSLNTDTCPDWTEVMWHWSHDLSLIQWDSMLTQLRLYKMIIIRQRAPWRPLNTSGVNEGAVFRLFISWSPSSWNGSKKVDLVVGEAEEYLGLKWEQNPKLVQPRGGVKLMRMFPFLYW